MKNTLIAFALAALTATTATATYAEGPSSAPAAPKPESQAASVGYKKGFFIKSADKKFQLYIQGRVQARYELGLPDEGRSENAFSIPRARLTLKGKAFTPGLSYKFQSDFGKGAVSLKDFYVDYAFKKWLRLRVGQYKRPFSRQQLSSSGRLELVDRAITDKAFGAGRDIGVSIHNNDSKSPTFEYAFGIFNGSGDNNVPKRSHPALVARVGYNYGKIKGYSEADLEGGPLRAAAGLSARLDLDTDDDDDSVMRAEVDYMVKVHGFSSTGAFYVSGAQNGSSYTHRTFEASGFHAQASYVWHGWFQPVVRYAMVMPDGADNNQQEIVGGIGVYFFKHGLKWQSDGGALISEEAGPNQTDYFARTQLQLSF